MRSRSTLLSHIISSNPQCFGIGETNRIYNSQYDISKHLLACSLSKKTKLVQDDFVVDQVNHNHMTPNLFDLDIKNKMYYIFLIRSPKESIQSAMLIFNSNGHVMLESEAIQYYKERVLFLKKLMSTLESSKYILIRSDELVKNADKALQKISTFLDLKIPLVKEYQKHGYTGTRGDKTENILSGEIKTDIPKHDYILKSDISEIEAIYNSITS